VFGKTGLRLERDQYDTKVIVFDERSGILTRAPGRLGVQAMDFGRQIEFQERARRRRCVRSTVGFVFGRVVHRKPLPDRQCFVSPAGVIIGHIAIEAVPACICSIMWAIMPSRIVRRCVTTSVTAAAVAAAFDVPEAAFIFTTSVSSLYVGHHSRPRGHHGLVLGPHVGCGVTVFRCLRSLRGD
jgi:hypothetical protein